MADASGGIVPDPVISAVRALSDAELRALLDRIAAGDDRLTAVEVELVLGEGLVRMQPRGGSTI